MGVFLYSRLRQKNRILGFIDSNPHKQKKQYCDLKVFDPAQITLGENVGLLVGLNPGVGERVIGLMPQFSSATERMFFLPLDVS